MLKTRLENALMQPNSNAAPVAFVPAVDQPLTAMAERYFQTTPQFITPGLDIGMPVLYDNPKEVGADRVVNGLAAFHRYGGPCVVVDLGTTINFDIVSARLLMLDTEQQRFIPLPGAEGLTRSHLADQG